MTSTEFAAKYRLLKNVANRGARTFLAQQIELGRMVMVHHLDADGPEQLEATLAQLAALRPSPREKLLEIVDVDGSPVAVTLFISSFTDFASWISQASEPPAARSPSASPSMPAATPKPAATRAGDFTGLFGRVDVVSNADTDSNEAEAERPGIAPPPDVDVNAQTLIIEPVRPPVPRIPQFGTPLGASDSASPIASVTGAFNAPPPAIERTASAAPSPAPSLPEPPVRSTPAPSPPAAEESAQDGSFTAIFGSPSRMSPPSPSFSVSGAAMTPPSPAERVMPPMAPEAERRRDEFASPPTEAPLTGGEFTQLFQRLNPGGAYPSSPTPRDAARPINQVPRADLSSPAPGLGGPGGAAFPPVISNAALPPTPSAAPAAPSWGAPTMPTAEGPSEFTRILGRVSPPPPPPIAAPMPTAIPSAQASAGATAKQRAKSYLPLIIALNLVLLVTIGIVMYFIVRG